MHPAPSPAPVILVVDDHEASRYLLCGTLARAGYRTVEAATGQEALERARELPDAILLDVRLPDVLGFEVCQRLKADPQTAAIPIIQMSASFTSTTDRVEGLQGGADGYLLAPVDPRELLAALRTLLHVHGVARERARALEAERATRAEVERANARLRHQAIILDNVQDSVVVTDMDGHITHWNRGATALFGYPAQEMLGGTLQCLYPEEDFSRLGEDLARIREGQDYRGEWKGRRRDGSTVWVDVHTTLLRDEHGQAAGFIGVAKDIDERKRLDEELRQRSGFEQQLIGIVSHDLRNPLSVMLLSASTLLRRGDFDARTSELLRRIVSNGERATRMIRDLLDFTQARLGGGIPLKRGPTDLNAVARAVVEDMRVAYAEREVVLEAASGDCRGTWDEDRLTQALTNLLANALTYSPEGSPVTTRTWCTELDVGVSIHNRGPPISPGRQRTLFAPLHRVGARDDTSGRSIGLGLYIVQHIVGAHGGTVELESAAETGTTFTVRLPRVPPGA